MFMLRRLALMSVLLLTLTACGEEGRSPAEGDVDTEASTACEEGPVTTDSGLQYEDIRCGEGQEAQRGDKVKVKYRGVLENGKEFDAGTFPFQIGVSEVIAGWQEGIQGMTVGGRRKLTIPPDLAYGEQGFPPVIPPDATLIFDVELLEVRSE